MKCFECVALGYQKDGEVVTQYQGTPLCQRHAQVLYEDLHTLGCPLVSSGTSQNKGEIKVGK